MKQLNSQAVIGRILEETKQRGAPFTEVLFSQGRSSLIRVETGQVYQPTAGDGLSISISSIIDLPPLR